MPIKPLRDGELTPWNASITNRKINPKNCWNFMKSLAWWLGDQINDLFGVFHPWPPNGRFEQFMNWLWKARDSRAAWFNPYISGSTWSWWDGVQCRVCRYAGSNWEFWMPKRRLEMLAVQNIGPIVLSMFHPWPPDEPLLNSRLMDWRRTLFSWRTAWRCYRRCPEQQEAARKVWKTSF